MTSRTTGGGGNSSYITLNIIKYSMAGWTVDYPEDVTYDGKEHKWEPTIRDPSGETITEDNEYVTPIVTYSTNDFKNVTGTITVTITLSPKNDNVSFEDPFEESGYYPSYFERTYHIAQAEITVRVNDQSKVAGTADPPITTITTGMIDGEVPGWTGSLTRGPGEAVGNYTIGRGTLDLADNPNGNFIARNYALRIIPGTLTITPNIAQ